MICAAACSNSEPETPASTDPTVTTGYATTVVSFTPGDHAGYGTEADVLGPPHGAGADGGNVADVLSLGAGGEIVLGFDGSIVDGDGPDFTVFENAFDYGSRVFAEYGEVSVSADGTSWVVFPCAPPDDVAACAGKTPVFANPDTGVSAFDPTVSGGDAFDLAQVGVSAARYVRIRDLETIAPSQNDGGFDLDAVAALHLEK